MEKTRPPGHPVASSPRQFFNSPRQFFSSHRQIFNSSISYQWWPASFFLPDNFSIFPDNFSILPDNFSIFSKTILLVASKFLSPRQFFISHRQLFNSPRQFFDFSQTKMRFSQTKSVYKFQVPSQFWVFSMPGIFTYCIFSENGGNQSSLCNLLFIFVNYIVNYKSSPSMK